MHSSRMNFTVPAARRQSTYAEVCSIRGGSAKVKGGTYTHILVCLVRKKGGLRVCLCPGGSAWSVGGNTTHTFCLPGPEKVLESWDLGLSNHTIKYWYIKACWRCWRSAWCYLCPSKMGKEHTHTFWLITSLILNGFSIRVLVCLVPSNTGILKHGVDQVHLRAVM